MRKYPTQEECRLAWLEMLKDWDGLDRIGKLEGIQRIDGLTPWSEREPKWWLEMMAMQTQLLTQ